MQAPKLRSIPAAVCMHALACVRKQVQAAADAAVAAAQQAQAEAEQRRQGAEEAHAQAQAAVTQLERQVQVCAGEQACSVKMCVCVCVCVRVMSHNLCVEGRVTTMEQPANFFFTPQAHQGLNSHRGLCCKRHSATIC